MAAILAVALRILSTVVNINSLVQAIASILGANNPNSPFNRLVQQVTAIVADVENVTYGLSALHAQLTDVQTAVVALGSPVQVGSPVTLPSTAPTGYGGGATASEVWRFPFPAGGGEAEDYLTIAGQMANLFSLGTLSFPSNQKAGWSLGGYWADASAPNPNAYFLPAFDPATILTTDATIPDWLDRAYPGHGSTYNAVGQPFQIQSGSNWKWTYYLGTVDFAEYKLAAFPIPPALNVAPVWPGYYHGVVYSGSFDLVDGLFIDQPMEGISVVIATTPPGSAQFVFGAAVSYRYLGAVTFETDSQDRETPQNLGFDQAIYLCKSMAHSTGARFRVRPGVTGTVYPFTIT